MPASGGRQTATVVCWSSVVSILRHPLFFLENTRELLSNPSRFLFFFTMFFAKNSGKLAADSQRSSRHRVSNELGALRALS